MGSEMCIRDSETFLKDICRAKKSVHLVEMEQITVHMVLILDRGTRVSPFMLPGTMLEASKRVLYKGTNKQNKK